MPAVLRRINRIFRRNSREIDNNNSNGPNNNMPINGRNRSQPDSLRRHQLHNHPHHRHGGHVNPALSHSAELLYAPAPIQLRSTGYQRQSDGSVTLSVTLDKDQVECCVCLSSMTGKIYRCRGNGPSSDNTKKTVCHNICSSCQWQMRRMKSGNGHSKEMQCPICKVKGSFVRNRALERQLMELSQQCVNGKHGCSQRFFPWDDRQKVHEKHLCAHQPVDCPFCYQSIPGGRVNFVEHLTKSVNPQNLQNAANSANAQNHQNVQRERSRSRSRSVGAAQDLNGQNLNQQNMRMRSGNGSPQYLESPEMEQIVEDDEDHSMMSQGDGPSDPVAPSSEQEQSDDISSDQDVDAQIVDIESGPEELMEDEEEEKEPINGHQNGMESMSNGAASKMDIVPPCLMQWHRSKEALDLTQTERNVISKQRNEFIVNYNLGVVTCFVAPTEDCPCWKVFAFSVSPRHGLGGNSRVYMQYLDDDVMNKFVAKEQSMGLVTQCLSRPVTTTLMVTLGRLHPTSMRKRFGSYPERNPFVRTESSKMEEEENMAAAKRKRMFSPRLGPQCEMKDDGDEEEEDDPLVLSNHNHNGVGVGNGHSRNSMDQDTVEMDTDDKEDDDNEHGGGGRSGSRSRSQCRSDGDIDSDSDLDEYEPTEFFGQSPCSPLQCGFIYAGNGQFGQKVIENLCVRVFTLEESFKVGAVIDARDFTGKWYQAEVIAVQDWEGTEHTNLDCDADDYLDIRRAKIHYLGYSQNYDEWLNVDTDSHRIAQRGTFTIGPDLRAIRRNTTNLQHGHHPDQPRSHSAVATFQINRNGMRERRANRYASAMLNGGGGNDNLDQ